MIAEFRPSHLCLKRIEMLVKIGRDVSCSGLLGLCCVVRACGSGSALVVSGKKRPSGSRDGAENVAIALFPSFEERRGRLLGVV